jgi:diphthamide synthase (EF-2-diphthine--ammonia ligase)
MNAVFPLWKMNTKSLVTDFIKAGFKAVVVCVDERWLDKSFAGKIIDEKFIASLPANVDPCGENGEFHSFVYDGPIFKFPVKFNIGEVVYKRYKPDKESVSNEVKASNANGFWYCDLIG